MASAAAAAAASASAAAAAAAAAALARRTGSTTTVASRFEALLRRRGFLVPTADVYGGISGSCDYGPAGAELKRNLASEWWTSMVHARNDVIGVDTAIVLPTRVWEASGHRACFEDRVIYDLLSRQPLDRFEIGQLLRDNSRIPIWAPTPRLAQVWAEEIRSLRAVGASVTLEGATVYLHIDKALEAQVDPSKELALKGPLGPVRVPYNGHASPTTNSPFLGNEGMLSGMVRVWMGADKDMTAGILQRVMQIVEKEGSQVRREALHEAIVEGVMEGSSFLRPETAQGMLIQALEFARTSRMRLPFGVAQIGKSFRNEVRAERLGYRSREFEQMELEWLCHPGEDMTRWLPYWRDERIAWWRRYASHPDWFTLKEIRPADGLAHYAQACWDIEFAFPWGVGEVEGVAARGDYDYSRHREFLGGGFLFPLKQPSEAMDFGFSNQQGLVPHIVEPSAGLTRGLLAILWDAYSEIARPAPEAAPPRPPRAVLKLHPRLAPYKAGVFPIVRTDARLVQCAEAIASDLRRSALHVMYDEKGSIGERYVRQDELGTPFCITVDAQTLESGGGQSATVTVRDRDTGQQERVTVSQVADLIHAALRRS